MIREGEKGQEEEKGEKGLIHLKTIGHENNN
jgi:hypothetical protein